jgi:hypothetical protein
VGPIAQSVEQRTFNPWVDGSSPSGPTRGRISLIHLVTMTLHYSERVLKPDG